jgi:hypothetical protein
MNIRVLGVVSCIILFSSCVSYNYDFKDFQGTYPAVGIGKNEFYKRANIWLVKNFVSAGAVKEYEDKEEGVIAGKFISNVLSRKFKTTVVIEIYSNYYFVYFSFVEFIKTGNYDYMTTITNDHIQAEWQKLADSLYVDMSKKKVNE